MDLERPPSRSGSLEQRPVTRWRREDRPPSRNGPTTDDSSRFLGEERPISRRGVKLESGYQQSDRPFTQRGMVMRPPSASAFNNRLTGTTSRLSSALLTAPHTGMGILPAQRERMVSQAGLAGPGTAVRGPATRQVQDKRYFESLLQLKTRELANELTRLRRQIESDSRDQATYLIYDKRVKEMAAELTELQGRLSDYNFLVDKVNMGMDRAEVLAETRDLATANQSEARILETIFTDRTRRQTQVNQLDHEIQQERQSAEKLVATMDRETLEQYTELRQNNERLSHQLQLLQSQLDALNNTRSGLQDQICLSSVKQEAVRLHSTLAELEGRRDVLREEEQSRMSPGEERERLLARVKQDNNEIASMERASAELREHIRQAQLNLQQANEDLNESGVERHSKYLELRRREETMEEFLSAWEETRAAEAERLAALESEVVTVLGSISRRLAALPGPADCTALDLDTLTADHHQLALYLNKVESMETKVRAELSALTDNLHHMQDEMLWLADLQGLQARAESRRLELNEERDNLLGSRDSVMQALQIARDKQSMLEKQLSENDAHAQLSSLERKLATLEQNNYSMREYIATRAAEANCEVVRAETLGLVRELNLALRDQHRRQN